jgi:hypothetical protein
MAVCEEKTRLTAEYQGATEFFSKSVKELQEKTGTSSMEEYERLKRASEEWRVRSEQARLGRVDGIPDMHF